MKRVWLKMMMAGALALGAWLGGNCQDLAAADASPATQAPTPPPPEPDTFTPTPVPKPVPPTPTPSPTPAPERLSQPQALVPLTISAAVQSGLVQAGREREKTNGFYTDVGLSQYLWVNGSPLSYNLGVGYEFESGIRLHTSLENFYFTGTETVNGATLDYSYAYNNWSTAADFAVPALSWLRPYAGASMDMIVNAQKSLKDVVSAPVLAAQGFVGAGFTGGALVKINRNWEAQASARLILTFSAIPNVSVFGLEGVYHFR